MVEYSLLAKPYSRAIFDFAKSKRNLKEWKIYLELLSYVINNSEIKNRIGISSKLDLFNFISNVLKGQVDKYFLNFVNILIQNERLVVVDSIISQFDTLLNKENRVKKVTVYSVEYLSNKEKEDLIKKLESKYLCTIQLENIIDRELIAGIVIKINETVYDNSLKNRFSILTASLQS